MAVDLSFSPLMASKNSETSSDILEVEAFVEDIKYVNVVRMSRGRDSLPATTDMALQSSRVSLNPLSKASGTRDTTNTELGTTALEWLATASAIQGEPKSSPSCAHAPLALSGPEQSQSSHPVWYFILLNSYILHPRLAS